MTTENTLLARQPIYDADLNIYAYELLFRSNNRHEDASVNADLATSTVLLNSFSEMGIHNVVGKQRAFVNFTRNLLLNPPPFASTEIVIEVLEDVPADEEVINSLKGFKEQGFTIALDDFEYQPSLQPLVDLADIIKIDVMSLSNEAIARHVEQLKSPNMALLAEKVETQEMYDYCKGLGFDYFQGYFLSRPKVVKGQTIANNKMVVMKLIADLQIPPSSPQKLHDTISRDPGLSFKLLRMVNSAAYRRANKIESLLQAIIMLGENNIRKWASLLALSQLDDKPHSLTELTMIRAKMCELTGNLLQPSQADLFFTVGMLSMMDAFFDTPLEELLQTMDLTYEIKEALLNHTGQLGLVLKTAIAYEQGNWEAIDWAGLAQSKLSISDIKEAYLDSLQRFQGQTESL